VGDWHYVDLEQSKQEALRLFDRNEAMRTKIENGARSLTSTGCRRSPRDINPMKTLATIAAQPGVLTVTDETESVKTVTAVRRTSPRRPWWSVAASLIAALLLILNAIRMAMPARRREIEVSEAGRRHQLVHPGAVHAGGHLPGLIGVDRPRRGAFASTGR
jgi:cell division protein FtsX